MWLANTLDWGYLKFHNFDLFNRLMVRTWSCEAFADTISSHMRTKIQYRISLSSRTVEENAQRNKVNDVDKKKEDEGRHYKVSEQRARNSGRKEFVYWE